jgi:hypothetical protein
MPLPVLENARNRVQVLTNLVFLMSSRTDMPEAARADLGPGTGRVDALVSSAVHQKHRGRVAVGAALERALSPAPSPQDWGLMKEDRCKEKSRQECYPDRPLLPLLWRFRNLGEPVWLPLFHAGEN